MKKKKEDTSQLSANLTRVTPQQLQFVQMQQGSRYVPVKSGNSVLYGIVVLDDTTPAVEEKIMNFEAVVETAVIEGAAAILDTPDVPDAMVE